MFEVGYYWNKFARKLKGKAIYHSKIDKSSRIFSGSTIYNVQMDRHSYCGYDCSIFDCKIGAFCSIGGKVSIGAANHPMAWVSTSPAFSDTGGSIKKKFAHHKYEVRKATVIGNDVWIGENVQIKSGVTIGNGAIIGMGSVVTKDVPDYAVVAGVPAKIIRMRFEPNIIRQLLETEWWNWEEDKLCEYAPLFNDVESFLKKWRDN